MNGGSLPLFTASILLVMVSAASAELPRCQCSYKDWVGDCKAKLEQKGKWIKVISNTQQCSRIEWLIDGEPHLTIVTDGAGMKEWLGKAEKPTLIVESCKICKDSKTQPSGRTPPRPVRGKVGRREVSGTWQFTHGCAGDSETLTLIIAGDTRATFSGGYHKATVTSFSRDDNRVNIVAGYPSWLFFQRYRVEYTGTLSANGDSMSGTYTQTATSDVCPWSARRQ